MADEPRTDVLARLDEDRTVWLATLRADGPPHVTPVWFVYVSQRWWIGTGAGSVKAHNCARDPRVSLALEDGDRPVVAEGRVSVHREFAPEVVDAFAAKYDWDVRYHHGDGDRVLLEIVVDRWLMAGSAPSSSSRATSRSS